MEGDQEEYGACHVEVHLDGMLARFGRTLGSADPTWQQLILFFLGESDMWALDKILWCICLGSPICSDLWVLFVSDTSQFLIFCAFFLVFTCVFSLLQMWVPAKDKSPKLVEKISHKPYI